MLEYLQRGDQIERPVGPGEAGEQIGHPDMADGPGRSVIDGELADITALGVDTPLA